ncbi:MAG: NAD(P)H-dependent oxidoreductase [Bacteroidota bacterium]
MESKPKILAFAGSTRKGSYNKKVLKIAVEAAQQAGAEVTVIDLKDYPMPLFDGDLEKEEGIPENGKKLMDLMIEHQGFLIASPEYNSSISGVLKNSIDWASRPVKGMKDLKAFEGKVACLMSASPGALGGLRGLVTVRSILGNIKVIVLPQQVAVSKADQAFDEDGKMKDEKVKTNVENLGKVLTEMIQKLNK